MQDEPCPTSEINSFLTLLDAAPGNPSGGTVGSPEMSSTFPADRVVVRLVEVMLGMYGAKFADAWRGTDSALMRRVWAQHLVGYTISEIAEGIEGCKALKWPPTLPEFLMLCRATIDADYAYAEACDQLRARETGRDVWSRPEIFHAAQTMPFELRTMTWFAVKTRWAAELRRATIGVANGTLPREVPCVPKALPDLRRTTPPPPDVVERLKSLVVRLRGGASV